MDDAYAQLAACYKRTTDHFIVKLNCSLPPGAWLESSCLAGRFFQVSPSSTAIDGNKRLSRSALFIYCCYLALQLLWIHWLS
jgi:hypothetical protein